MMAIVMEFCRLGNLFKMIQMARELQAKLLTPGFQVDPRISRTYYYRFYLSWERRMEVTWRSDGHGAYFYFHTHSK